MLKHPKPLNVATTVAVLALWFLVAMAVPASAAFPGTNGRIAHVTSVNGHRAIQTVDAGGADPQPLIDLGDRDAINAAWSWDGTRIAFAGQTSPGGPFAIFVANADGTGQPVQVTTPPVSDSDPSWSPNGREIAFVRELADGSRRIFTADLTTLATRPLGASLGTDLEPSWSPDTTKVAFATKPSRCPQPPCRFGIVIAWADGSGLAGTVGDPFVGPYQDYHHPDWSPDGRTIVAAFGVDEDPLLPSGVGVYDAATGGPVVRIGPCGIMTEPSFSPDGVYVVVTSRTFVDMDSTELTEPKLCVMRADNTALAFMVDAPASDAAWGPVPGSAPPIPEPDRTPPTVELAFTPEPGPSGWFSSPPDVEVTATDNVGVSRIRCTYDGQWIGPYEVVIIDHGLRGQVSLYGQGEHTLECIATDLSENTGIVSSVIQIDITAPFLEPFSFTANPIQVGETSVVSAVAWDDRSGIASGEVTVGDQPPVPMAVSGSTVTAEIGPGLPADLYLVSVRVRDGAGNVASPTPQILVVYDPTSGSAGGTGWIVPGGSSSEPGDVLPGLDGVSKGSFGFTAKYKNAASTAPSGRLHFSYESLFKLQSTSLEWLVLRDAERAYIGGTATISGIDGEFQFVATVHDGSAAGGSDRFVIKVYAPGANPAVDAPLYQASGDAGGQIQIQR